MRVKLQSGDVVTLVSVDLTSQVLRTLQEGQAILPNIRVTVRYENGTFAFVPLYKLVLDRGVISQLNPGW